MCPQATGSAGVSRVPLKRVLCGRVTISRDVWRPRLWRRALALCLLCVPATDSRDLVVRYLSFAEVEETIRLNGDSGLAGSDIHDSVAWNEWIRAADSSVRARIDRGIEDSISNFILYGTSFTDLARIQGVEYAASDEDMLATAVTARIHSLATALRSSTQNERVRLVRDFLARKQIPPQTVEEFFKENLSRFVGEQRAYRKKLEDAGSAGDPNAVFLTRGTLFETRGLSVDTSLLPNFALEDTLRVMIEKSVLSKDSIRRVAVIGPGLDFTDKRDGYDFYPLQTVQPFAVLDALRRLGLGRTESVQLTCLDLNPWVIAHVRRLADLARTGRSYTVQLPRDVRAEWSPVAISYWEHFGEMLGSSAKPLPTPAALGEVVVRAVAIESRFAANITAYDLNIVTQTLDLPPSQKFDLVIATNVLVYYDRLQQALAMANIARMMNPKGVFLANSVLPSQHTDDLEFLGRRNVSYTLSGAYGDDVVVYRRR